MTGEVFQATPELCIGFLLLIATLMKSGPFGLRGIATLRSVSLVSVWVAFQFSACMIVLGAPTWKTSLLVPQYIVPAIRFSLFSMFAIFMSYEICGNRRGRAHRLRRISIPNVELWHVVALCSVTLALFVVVMRGNFAAIWDSPYPRGRAPWAGSVSGGPSQIATILLSVSQVLLSGASAAYALPKEGRTSRVPVAVLGLLIATLPFLQDLSRAAGGALIITSFVSLRYQRRKVTVAVSLAVLLSAFLGYVAIQARLRFHPGISNFLSATITPFTDDYSSNSQGAVSAVSYNFFDFLPVWTTEAYLREHHVNDETELYGAFIWNLNPLPSILLPLKKIGRDLADWMGTSRTSGITPSALGELYYVFGYWGALFFVPVGLVCRRFDELTAGRLDIASLFLIVVTASGIPVGVFNSVRAMSRAFLYSVTVYWTIEQLSAHRRSQAELGACRNERKLRSMTTARSGQGAS